MLSGVSDTAAHVDAVFLFLSVTCVALLALITGLMIYFVVRYNYRRTRRVENIEGNIGLEILWTVIPTLLVLVMFYYGWKGFDVMRHGPDDAMQVKVVGRMWSWAFVYENGIQSPGKLILPAGEPVKLVITSQDVLHSFYIPAFRMKMDAVPGKENYIWVTPERPGIYQAFCAEYCGLQHSSMLASVEVTPKDRFERWYAENAPETPPAQATAKEEKSSTPASSAKRGAALYAAKGCQACHSTDGSPKVGPTFKGLFGSSVTVLVKDEEKTVTADEEYLRQSILDPNADVVKGFQPVMPPQEGILSDEEVDALIDYLKELK